MRDVRQVESRDIPMSKLFQVRSHHLVLAYARQACHLIFHQARKPDGKIEASGDEFKVGIARHRMPSVLHSRSAEVSKSHKGSMRTNVFEAIQVLVALATDITAEWLFLFHAQGSRIGGACLRVDNRKRAVAIFVQLLSLMPMRFMIPIPDRVSHM
jgi:hypothetical protein